MSQPVAADGQSLQSLKQGQFQSQVQQGVRLKVVKKILVKAVDKDKGKDSKIFTLRNIPTDSVSSCGDLKRVIKNQLDKDIIDSPFDVGFMQNNSAISIRSDEDLIEIWDQVHSGKIITLWCDGLKSSRGKANKRAHSEESNDKDVRSKKNKSDKRDTSVRVEETETKLKEAHGTTYTQMQYKVWAEMFVGGAYSSLQDPPSSQMFIRCGTGGASISK